MKRHELEHLIRAAGSIVDESALIVIGSQAILGQFPAAPAAALHSMEADLIPLTHPERWALIDGAIGEGSPFHQQFGYYADGVELGTAVLPAGWRERLFVIQNDNTRGIAGLCLEVHDLLISKYVAGRHKDLGFCAVVRAHGLADGGLLLERLAATELAPALAEIVRARILAAPPAGG